LEASGFHSGSGQTPALIQPFYATLEAAFIGLISPFPACGEIGIACPAAIFGLPAAAQL
jgi:hypothetical protein